MCLFTFHNEFDDIDVNLDDESYDSSGPFSVEIIYNAPEIMSATENQRFEYKTLSEAKAKFLEWVNHEINAVLAEVEQ